jgi:hypothetical protein
MPPVLATAGLVLIGIFIAERFRTLDAMTLRRIAPAAVGSFLTSMMVATVFAAGAAALSAWPSPTRFSPLRRAGSRP